MPHLHLHHIPPTVPQGCKRPVPMITRRPGAPIRRDDSARVLRAQLAAGRDARGVCRADGQRSRVGYACEGPLRHAWGGDARCPTAPVNLTQCRAGGGRMSDWPADRVGGEWPASHSPHTRGWPAAPAPALCYSRRSLTPSAPPLPGDGPCALIAAQVLQCARPPAPWPS